MKTYIYVSTLGVVEHESTVPNYLFTVVTSKSYIFEKVKADWYNMTAGGQTVQSFSLEDIFKLYYNEFIKPRFTNQFSL